MKDKMKKVFALYGKAEIGKTETLNLLIDLLTVATSGCTMPVPMPKGHDRRSAFLFKDLKVGVATRGDNAEEVIENCIFFEKEECDIAFSATRTRGGSCNEIVAYARRNGVDVKWERKEDILIINERKLFNQNLANLLFDKI